MTKHLAAIAAAAVLLPAAAHAAQADGTTCGMVAANDGDVAVVWTAPVRANALTDTITVVCSVQVGNAFHGGPVATSVSATGTGVTPLVVEERSYPYPVGDPEVYLCTRWIVNGVDHFYDAPSGTFTTAAGATCDRAIRQNLDPVSPICVLTICVNLHAIVDEVHVVTPKPASANTTT